MKVLIVRPSDDMKKGFWAEMEHIPHKGDQLYFMGNSYDISMVKYFLNADDIPEYKNNTPFVRLMLMNQ